MLQRLPTLQLTIPVNQLVVQQLHQELLQQAKVLRQLIRPIIILVDQLTTLPQLRIIQLLRSIRLLPLLQPMVLVMVRTIQRLHRM